MRSIAVKPLLFAGVLIGAAASLAASPEEASFLAENDGAMKKMMAGMDIKPSGDIDRDFVIMMSAHHQGAIEMAQAELRYGRNERLRRLAQEIIVTQQAEIAAMWLAIGQRPPPETAPSSADAAPHQHSHMHEAR